MKTNTIFYISLILIFFTPLIACTTVELTPTTNPQETTSNENVRTSNQANRIYPPVDSMQSNSETTNKENIEANSQQALQEIEHLSSELQTALKTKAISPDTYTEIHNKITILESKGYITESIELRNLLSQLEIGGQSISQTSNPSSTTPSSIPLRINQTPNTAETTITVWQSNGQTWTPKNTPPPCPSPLILQSPVDLNLVTSILYPGQVRGGDYKPHGGFRTDKTTGPIEVRAPMDGYIVNLAKFNDEFGIHYMLDIQHPCGIMYRLGHLGAVPPKIEAVFSSVPQNADHDSRTHEVVPFFIKQGEIIATNTQQGSGFDWGVYDLREENLASQDQTFRQAHSDEAPQAYHALCWFDLLPSEQKSIVKSLPAADGKSGKTSAYC